MKSSGSIDTILRVGWAVLGVWLIGFGAANGLDCRHPIVGWGLSLTAMITGIIFLFAHSGMVKSEIPAMILFSIFMFAMGVIPRDQVVHFHPESPLGVLLWGDSLLAGCLLPIGLAQKRWGDRLGLAFLSVWLIIWPVAALADERPITLLIGALFPAVTGLIILGYSLTILIRPTSRISQP